MKPNETGGFHCVRAFTEQWLALASSRSREAIMLELFATSSSSAR